MQNSLAKQLYGGIMKMKKEMDIMLLEFSCSNYKSIMNKVTFSFLASKDDTYEDELKSFSNFKVLRSAVIYGPNGSGKSNFLNAIEFMQGLILNSINYQPGDDISQYAHKLSGDETPSIFSMQFIKNDIRYAYGFSLRNRSVDEEYLYYFPKNRQVKIFERKGISIKPGDKYKSAFELSYEVLKENRLFLSCAANFSKIKEIEQAFLFFKEDIVVYNPEVNNWTEYSMKLIQKNEKIKEIFINILNSLGTGIRDIDTKFEKRNIRVTDLSKEMPDTLKSLLFGETNQLSVKLIYDHFETDLVSEESRGVKKLFEVICPIIDILKNGKILICDEIETSLHESIVWEIVSLFKKAQTNKFAQLLFTTHDTSLLDSKLFRRDQIWFTELDDSRSTDLYSLAEIKNVRKTENLRNGYMLGKYRAMPIMSQNIYSLFNDDKKEGV